MQLSLNLLAQRANMSEQSPGFLKCLIENEEQRLLAFHFDTDINANKFMAARHTLNMQAYIPNERPCVVIVRQP